MTVTRELCEQVVNNFVNEAFFKKISSDEQSYRLAAAAPIGLAAVLGAAGIGIHGEKALDKAYGTNHPSDVSVMEPVGRTTTPKGNFNAHAAGEVFKTLANIEKTRRSRLSDNDYAERRKARVNSVQLQDVSNEFKSFLTPTGSERPKTASDIQRGPHEHPNAVDYYAEPIPIRTAQRKDPEKEARDKFISDFLSNRGAALPVSR